MSSFPVPFHQNQNICVCLGDFISRSNTSLMAVLLTDDLAKRFADLFLNISFCCATCRSLYDWRNLMAVEMVEISFRFATVSKTKSVAPCFECFYGHLYITKRSDENDYGLGSFRGFSQTSKTFFTAGDVFAEIHISRITSYVSLFKERNLVGILLDYHVVILFLKRHFAASKHLHRHRSLVFSAFCVIRMFRLRF